MCQLVSRILQHGPHISFALIIEKSMRRRIHITKVRRPERFYHITGLIIQLAEIIRMRLDLHADTFTLDQRKQLLHGFEPHSIADFLLVRITGKLCINNLYAHISRNLDHPFPVGNCKLSLFLCGAGPAVYDDKGRNLHAGFPQSLSVFLFTLLGKQRMFIERIDPRMWRLLDIFISPVCHLMDHTIDIHLFCKHIYIKCDLHDAFPPFSSLFLI